MASGSRTTSSPQKRLAEFLNEQQEPFILEVYLLENGFSKKWRLDRNRNGESSHADSSKLKRSASYGSNNRKSGPAFAKVLTAVCKKLAFYNESKTRRDSEDRNEDVGVAGSGRVGQTERFSSACSSTVFHSCSEVDEKEASGSSHKDQSSFSSGTWNACNIRVPSRQAAKNGERRRRRIEDSLLSLAKIPPRRFLLSQNDETINQNGRMEERIRSCGVLLPKKITEDSLLSAALWGFLIQSAKKEKCSMELRELLGPNVSQILKSRRVLQKKRQLLFDCVREIMVKPPRKENGQQFYKHLLGPEELVEIICEKTKEWGRQVGDETNLSYLLTLDYLNSVKEWCDYEPHIKHICVGIADAILESINNEIVSELVGLFATDI